MRISFSRDSLLFHVPYIIIILVAVVFRSPDKFFDVNNYIDMYRSVCSGRAVNAEYSFVLLSKLSGFIGFSYLGVFYFYAMISVLSKYYFLRYFIFRQVIACALYGVSYFILYEFVQMRVGAAFGVFLVALVYYSRGMLLVSLAVCFVASFLHYSILPLVFLLFTSPVFLRANVERFMGLSLSGYVFLFVTVFFMLYYVLMCVFPSLDFRYVLMDFTYETLRRALPARLYDGYIGIEFTPVFKVTFKQVLSLGLSLLSVVVLWFRVIKKEWIYYFSCFMVVCSFWIYLFFGQFGLMAERLSEILILFVIVVVDGVIKKNKILGYSLFFVLGSIFLINLLMRASYFSLV